MDVGSVVFRRASHKVAHYLRELPPADRDRYLERLQKKVPLLHPYVLEALRTLDTSPRKDCA